MGKATRVSELMSRHVATINADATCHEAAERMYRQRIRHLPVVAADGALKGIVTDRDLRHHLFRPGVFEEIGDVPVESLLRSTLVEAVMSTPVLRVTPEEDVEVAARLMAEHKVGALPVVEQGRVVGVLTESDLLRQIIAANACCTEVETIVVSYP
jgi:CBS domain-containing protein